MRKFEKKLITIDNQQHEYAVAGQGRPVVVFVNGSGGPMEGWHAIFHEVSQASTVFTYNRAGIGRSSKPVVPQDGETIISTLRQLMLHIGLRPPYILVGHSLGGLYVQLYARIYPDEIAGIVLIESSHPDDMQINEMQGPFVRRLNRLLSMFDHLSKHHQYVETQHVAQTVQQIQQAGSFPEVPLYVIAGGRKSPMMPEQVFQLRKEHQLALSHLNSQGKHIVAPRSGHFPQMTDTDLVLQTLNTCIRDVNI